MISEKKSIAESIVEFYKDKENVLKLVFVILNSINIVILTDTVYCVPISIVLLYLYFKLSSTDYKEKKALFLTIITFTLGTLFGEMVVITTKKALTYTKPDIYNVPSWLLPVYMTMVMNIILTVNFYKKV